MENINLDDFSDLKKELEGEEEFTFIVSDHREGKPDEIKEYTIGDVQDRTLKDKKNNIYIDIYSNYVKLKNIERNINHVYKFEPQDIDSIGKKSPIEGVIDCIILVVDKWKNNHLE